MSATNTTTNLGLSQFVNTDVPAWRQDYNGDMLKIDNAYTADISGATAETSADPSDYMKFYDVSATTNKKILISDLLKGAKVEDLTDTDITTPANDDGLVYDATAQKWENKQITTKEQWQKNGAYNLCPNDLISQVEAGITYQTLSDKTIQASGTASGSSSIWITKNIKLKKGTYKICGTPSGGHYNNGYALYVTIGNTAIATDTENTFGLSDIFTVTNEATLYNLGIVVRSGVTAPSAPFKPMITTDLNATYADFVPYAKTNRELTEKVDELYGSTNNKISYIRGYYQYSNTISNILTLIQNFLTDISITNDIGVVDVVIVGNTPWSVRGYCFSTKDFAVLTAMRYDGSCKLFYRMSSTDTIKDFTTT